MIYRTKFKTPLGEMIALSTKAGVSYLGFSDQKSAVDVLKRQDVSERENENLKLLREELKRYFKGDLKKFTVPLDISGTDFQRRAWRVLAKVPFGKTVSYSDQAKKVGSEKAVRAIANSNAKNRVAIILPCHRIVGKDGSLTGYAGGLERKKWLIEHERGAIA